MFQKRTNKLYGNLFKLLFFFLFFEYFLKALWDLIKDCLDYFVYWNNKGGLQVAVI